MPDNHGAVDLNSLSKEDQDKLATMAEEHGTTEEDEGVRHVITAFMIVVNPDGSPQVMAFDDANLIQQSPPTAALIRSAITGVLHDLQVHDISTAAAALTAQAMVEQMVMMAEQQQAQSLAQRLGDVRLRG